MSAGWHRSFIRKMSRFGLAIIFLMSMMAVNVPLASGLAWNEVVFPPHDNLTVALTYTTKPLASGVEYEFHVRSNSKSDSPEQFSLEYLKLLVYDENMQLLYRMPLIYPSTSSGYATSDYEDQETFSYRFSKPGHYKFKAVVASVVSARIDDDPARGNILQKHYYHQSNILDLHIQPQDIPDKPELSFTDFRPLEGLKLYQQFKDHNTIAGYSYYEYKTKLTLQQIADWFQEESKRWGLQVQRHYSYSLSDRDIGMDVYLPNPNGLRKLTLYSQLWGQEKRISIVETTFQPTDRVHDDDTATIFYLPTPTGELERVFRGYYYHEHTDIYTLYFLTLAYSKELHARQALSPNMPQDFEVGYFDNKGEELYPEDVTLEMEESGAVHFGIQFDELNLRSRETVLFLNGLALTILAGYRAFSGIVPSYTQIDFLDQGKVIKSYRLSDLKGMY